MSNTNQIKIKAKWTNYGPKYYIGGKRLNCEGDTDSWVIAAYGLWSWMDRYHPGASPVFCGPSAEQAKKGWEDFNK